MSNQFSKNIESLRKQQLCLKCLKCCKIMLFEIVSHGYDYVKEFYEIRGFEVKQLSEGNVVVILRNEKCPHITEKGCDIYKRRPYVCRAYDGRLDPVLGTECAWNELRNDQILMQSLGG